MRGLVVGGNTGRLRKIVLASLTGLPLSSLVLGQALAADPPVSAPVEAPSTPPPHGSAEPSAAAAPSDAAAPPPEDPPFAPDAAASEATASDAAPSEAPKLDPTRATPSSDAPSAEAAADAPASPDSGPSPSDDEGRAGTRDSIFDAGHGARQATTIALGGVVDAIDPRAAAGVSVRVPQFAFDARQGLGKGWSLVAHVNTILAINELDLGASFAFPILGDLRGLVQFQAGLFVGMLGGFGFQSLVVAPQFRPLVGVSLPAGNQRWSLRGEVVFSGPYSATLGDTSSTLATPPPVANWNVGLLLENLMRNDRLWYAGLVLMASTASYQNWLLFPDTSYYDVYPRVMGGYEF